MGTSILEYPKLQKQSGEYKIIETRAVGKTATLKYEGGSQIVVDVSDPSQVVYRFSDVPADVKTFHVRTVVGLGQGPDRKWKFGEQAGVFPLEKPAKPHLYQGHDRAFTITNYENRTVTFTVPEHSYQQLTDAREWGWSAFLWTVNIPNKKDHASAAIQIVSGSEGEIKKVTLVDKFGQAAHTDWPLKVKSEEELKADVENEREYYASLKPPPLDKYGGLPGSREKLGLQATGFFHVEKKNGRWLLVNPDGNAFFHLGVCVFGPSDDFTLIKGREQIYEWLPPADSEYKTAFRPGSSEVFSFHLANQIRKYNEPYALDSYVTRMIDRARKFGFNSIGAFSPVDENKSIRAANFPYVSFLPLDQWVAGIHSMPGTHGVWDPFDEQNRSKLEQSFAKRLPSRAADPLIIGYFLANEPLFEDVPRVVPSLPETHAAKRRLVQMLAEKYKTIDAFNTAWELDAKSFEELRDVGIAVKTKAASADMQEFYGLFLDSYFQLVADTFRKYDKNHLLIGNRLQSATINNEQLCRVMGKYLDVVSYNYYTYALDSALLTRLHHWTGDKPMMLTEFYWSSPKDSGLSSRQDVSNQQERGLAYRNYVEQAAALPFVVGIEWFTLVDQAATGRWFSGFNGEAHNTGLFSVADRPWKPLLEEMSKTNYDIYKVWLGERKPFVFNDPRFVQKGGGKKNIAIARAGGPIKIDGIAENWPGVPSETISSARLVEGSAAEGLEASFKLCWDDTNLYLLANVMDSTPMQNQHPGVALWSGDGIELFIGGEKVGEGGPLLFTDRQVLLGAASNNQQHYANAPQQYVSQTAVVRGVDGKSYTLEAAIPWTALAIQPTTGQELQFDIAINDSSDGNRRERQLMWNGTTRNSGDRTHWGRATLVR